MNNDQREKITELRKDGFGYKRTAKAVGISLDSVKSFCRTHNLTGNMAARMAPKVCRECGRVLVQPEKKKPLKFCNSVCRETWWRENRSKVNKKSAEVMECRGCGKEILAYKHEHRKYCSHSCYITTRFGEMRTNEKANNE